MHAQIINLFKQQFNAEPQLIISAPGRINLIGEHTDYNMGWVMPAAINKQLYLAFSNNESNEFVLRAAPVSEVVVCNSENLFTSTLHWSKYLCGIIEILKQKGHSVKGFNLAFNGNIPLGAGLSSSAALCCGFVYGLNELNNLKLTKVDMALIAQKAEHEYAGVKCGIMDQYAVLFGKEKHFIKLDCRSLEVEYVPASLDGCTLILTDSLVKHKLAESAYNKRREECEEGVITIQKKHPEVKSLRDVSMQMLLSCKDSLTPIVFNRCRYVVGEAQRHADVCEALQLGNIKKVGELLYQTHLGLKNDYEVSCVELDFLVDTASKTQGVIGSRMMGGGFGGCTLSIVETPYVENFKQEISKHYQEKFNITPSIFEVGVNNGVSII